jgi:hypothetical protein
MMGSLLDKLGLWAPRNSRHVSRLPSKDVPIFLEEFDGPEFLIGIQDIAYVSNLRRFLHRQWDLLVECVLWLDGLFGILRVSHDQF